MAQIDNIQVGRIAHELTDRYGWNAHKYAANVAVQALTDGQAEEFEFWSAVEAALKPRTEESSATRFSALPAPTESPAFRYNSYRRIRAR
jgi:hypothetical protein